MRFIKGLRRLPPFIAVLVRDPGQIRYLIAWWSLLRKQPFEARLPWLPFRVMERLKAHLTPTSRVFEFGGGGSTLWFIDNAGEVTTVEHDPHWAPVLQAAVAKAGTATVIQRSDDNNYADYVATISAYSTGYFDVVVVDGRERVRCMAAAMDKVKPGGLLVLDDTDRERYRPAFELAASWPSRTYRGLTPSKTMPGVTTIWQRPAAEGIGQ